MRQDVGISDMALNAGTLQKRSGKKEQVMCVRACVRKCNCWACLIFGCGIPFMFSVTNQMYEAPLF